MAEPVLIAAVSGRALAEAARRAGFSPLVADAFGDCDTLAAAAAFRLLPGLLEGSLRERCFLAALEALAASQPRPPLGVIFGAGFEASPQLIAAAARSFRLIGPSANVTHAVKHPALFLPRLWEAGVPLPETRLDLPEMPATAKAAKDFWLMKPIGGSGGMHIAPWRPGAPVGPGRYFQKRLAGESVSLLMVAYAQEIQPAGFTRQWTTPSSAHPFRYGGAAGPVRVSPLLAARMLDIAGRTQSALGLRGLVSLDFLVTGEGPRLVDVNPRPGATLEVLDGEDGRLLAAHVEACLSGKRRATSALSAGPQSVRAAAYLYADQGPLCVPVVSWPPWVADRPRAGTIINAQGPAATVRAEAHTLEEALSLCQNRLGQLADMLYGGHNTRGDAP